MNKFLVAVSVAALMTAPALAGNKHHGNNPPPPSDEHTYNYNYTYKYKYGNNNYWGDPYLWAPIIGGVVGGLIERSAPPPQYVPAPQYYEQPCQPVIMPVFIESLGVYRNMPVQVCQ